PIGLSKFEAVVALYIFCKEMVEDINKKEIIVATELRYCDGNRRLLQTLKPRNEIEQDVDEGTRLRIALDLALNPSNTVQEVIMQRALDWMEELQAGCERD
ncbi:Ulp1 protease family, carboxy-terminal domain protein, partial [Sesbania bispinosa]